MEVFERFQPRVIHARPSLPVEEGPVFKEIPLKIPEHIGIRKRDFPGHNRVMLFEVLGIFYPIPERFCGILFSVSAAQVCESVLFRFVQIFHNNGGFDFVTVFGMRAGIYFPFILFRVYLPDGGRAFLLKPIFFCPFFIGKHAAKVHDFGDGVFILFRFLVFIGQFRAAVKLMPCAIVRIIVPVVGVRGFKKFICVIQDGGKLRRRFFPVVPVPPVIRVWLSLHRFQCIWACLDFDMDTIQISAAAGSDGKLDFGKTIFQMIPEKVSGCAFIIPAPRLACCADGIFHGVLRAVCRERIRPRPIPQREPGRCSGSSGSRFSRDRLPGDRLRKRETGRGFFRIPQFFDAVPAEAEVFQAVQDGRRRFIRERDFDSGKFGIDGECCIHGIISFICILERIKLYPSTSPEKGDIFAPLALPIKARA